MPGRTRRGGRVVDTHRGGVRLWSLAMDEETSKTVLPVRGLLKLPS